MNWHNYDLNQLFGELNTSAKGLTSLEAQNRLKKYGKNALVEKQRKSPVIIFLNQFTDFLIIILIISAIISSIVGELNDSLPIIFIVIINAIIGFIQEYRAEKAMDALKKMATPNCTILRDNQNMNISSENLVPGDLVFLEAGNITPADLRE